MPNQIAIETQLKEASQLTDATWAALVEREAGKWRIISHFHLGKKAQPTLVKFLSKAEVDSWLCGALSGGQSRSVSLSNLSTLDAARLFAFPLTGVSRVVLAGADQLTNESQRLWRLIVSGMQNESAPADTSALSSVAASHLYLI
ncbi:MAG TPA: hypothetical protein VKE92_06965 [Anaerolineales bacterium]|nr:hypothetical protein [Anaerolineales bacterium]